MTTVGLIDFCDSANTIMGTGRFFGLKGITKVMLEEKASTVKETNQATKSTGVEGMMKSMKIKQVRGIVLHLQYLL